MGTGLHPGYRLVDLAAVDSTNAEALRRIETGDGAGTVIRADRQTRGRGRKGARWESPEGNLHMSLVVEPPDPSTVGQISFLAAVAAGQGVEDLAGPLPDLAYKWPNDLMIGGAKLGGILIEGGLGGVYVVGIGLNIVGAPEVPEHPTVALRDLSAWEGGPGDLLVTICNRFAEWYDLWRSAGFGPVRETWLRRAAGIGSAVEARLLAETRRGVFRDIGMDGALILELADGTCREITAGAIYFA